jgi:hypothetical protein
VAEQFHECRIADAAAKHFGGESMTEHVGDNAPGNANRGSHFGQFGAEVAQQRAAIMAASQQQAVGWDGAQRSKEAQAVHELRDEIVDGHQAFGV